MYPRRCLSSQPKTAALLQKNKRHRKLIVYLGYDTCWHLTASCRPLSESTSICWDNAHVVSLLLIGRIHTVVSSTSLCCSYTCITHLLPLLHVGCFLLMRTHAAMIRSTACTPTTSVQPSHETASPLVYAGWPRVRLSPGLGCKTKY